MSKLYIWEARIMQANETVPTRCKRLDEFGEFTNQMEAEQKRAAIAQLSEYRGKILQISDEHGLRNIS